MAQDNATMTAIHQANSAIIVAKVSANYTLASTIAAPIGRPNTPGCNPDFMQGTSGGVQPTAFKLTRS